MIIEVFLCKNEKMKIEKGSKNVREAETEVEKLKVSQRTQNVRATLLTPPAHERFSLSDPRRAGVRGQEGDACTRTLSLQPGT